MVKEQLKVVARAFDKFGAVYYSVSESGTALGKARVNLSRMLSKDAEKLVELLGMYLGKTIVSNKGALKGWELTGNKACVFLSDIYEYIDSPMIQKQISLYALGYGDYLRGQRMTVEVVIARKEVADEIAELRRERRKAQQFAVAALFAEGIEQGDIYNVISEDHEVVEVKGMVMLDHRTGTTKAAYQILENEKPDDDAERVRKNIESFGEEWNEINRKKIEEHDKKYEEIGKRLGVKE